MTGARIARCTGTAVAVTLLCGLAVPAQAQNVGDNFVVPYLPLEYDRGRNTGVLDRARPEFQAQGVNLGGFTLLPRVDATAGYTDNVYSIKAPKRSDGFVDFSPSARLVSNWSRHALELEAGANLRRFLDETARNQDGWYVGGNGTYDIGGGTRINAAAQTRHTTEPATSPAYPTTAAEASQYQETTAQIGASYAPTRLRLEVAYNFTAFAFNNVRTLQNTIIDQGNRDSHTNSGTARVEYAISPDTSLFVQGSYDRTDYRRDLLPGIANRDSDTYRALAGVTFDLATLVRGAVGAGYIRRSYDAALYSGIGGLTAELRLEYFPTPLTTIGLTGRRIIEDASYYTAAGALSRSGGFVNNTIALRADHELLRNVLLNLQAAYEHDNFTASPSSLDIVRVSGGARYLVSRNMGFGLTVAHDSRNASGPLAGPSYGETRVMLSVAFQK